MITKRHLLSEKTPKEDSEIIIGVITPTQTQLCLVRYLSGVFYKREQSFFSTEKKIVAKYEAKDIAFWEEKVPIDWVSYYYYSPKESTFCVVANERVKDWRQVAFYHKENDTFYGNVEKQCYATIGNMPLNVTHYIEIAMPPYNDKNDD